MVGKQTKFDLLQAGHRDVLGEGPWWSVEDQVLIWVDILGRRVRRAGLGADLVEDWSTPSEVGFCVPTIQGNLLMGLRDGLYCLNPSTGDTSSVVAVEPELTGNRINDGKTDRQGRLWFGSMHEAESEATGSLYRFDRDGLTPVISDVTTSNGLGWSPDNSTMYHTDSMARSIFAYDYEAESGVISNGRLFAEDPTNYVPDGLTVDSDGCVWAAKWDGGKVVRYSPKGAIDLEFHLPVSRPTSCCFVGSDMRTLAVTSAKAPERADYKEDLAGSVFLIQVSAQGIPDHPTTAPLGREGSPLDVNHTI